MARSALSVAVQCPLLVLGGSRVVRLNGRCWEPKRTWVEGGGGVLPPCRLSRYVPVLSLGVIDLKSAKALGHTVPPAVLALVNEMIECMDGMCGFGTQQRTVVRCTRICF